MQCTDQDLVLEVAATEKMSLDDLLLRSARTLSPSEDDETGSHSSTEALSETTSIYEEEVNEEVADDVSQYFANQDVDAEMEDDEDEPASGIVEQP